MQIENSDMKRRSVIITIAAVVATAIASSCSKMDLAGITDRLDVDIPMIFEKIDVEDAIIVVFSPETDMVRVESDVNVLPYVEVYMKGKVLKIGYDRGLRPKDWHFKTVVTVPYKEDISSVLLSGASTFESLSKISRESFSLDLSGASSFRSELAISGKLNIKASGASEAHMSGHAKDLYINLSGASKAAGMELGSEEMFEITNCYGDLSGASEAYFHCTGKIDCNLSGASRIYYSGTADTSSSSLSGASEIVRID